MASEKEYQVNFAGGIGHLDSQTKTKQMPALSLVCVLIVWVYTDLLISIGYGLNHGGVNSGLQLWFGV